MQNKHVRLIMVVEAIIEDPVAVRADQLALMTNPETGEAAPVTWGEAEDTIAMVTQEAAVMRLRDLPGVQVRGASSLIWPRAEDGSWPAFTLPRMSSPDELRRRKRESSDEETGS